MEEHKNKSFGLDMDIDRLKELINGIDEKDFDVSRFGRNVHVSKKLNIKTELCVTDEGLLQFRIVSDLFTGNFHLNPTLPEAGMIINKWLEKVSKLKEEMKVLNK